MRPRPVLVALVALVVSLALPSGAAAGWFPGEPLDQGDLVDVAVDVARDGSGALAYVKREGGVGHVFLSRIVGGAAQSPLRVDGGIETGATEVTVAVADEGRVAIAWVAGTRVYGVLVGDADDAPGGPVELGGEGSVDVALDMGINGTAYAVWTNGSDVRAARLQATAWEPIPGPLDIDQGNPAGLGASRARVAVSAEGNAVATWGEAGGVWGRRITGLVPSLAPQLVSVHELAGLPGGTADSPDIDIEDDGSYAWVAWRQDLGGTSRALARRLVGSQFEAPVAIDAGAGVAPDIDLTGRGLGVAASDAGGAVVGALLERDVFGTPFRIDGAGGVEPVVAIAERERSVVVYRRNGLLVGRHREEDARRLDPEVVLSRPELGAVAEAGFAVASDRIGDFAVPLLHGPPGERILSLAVYDRPALRAQPSTTANYQRRSRPRLIWQPGLDLWGEQTFRVYVDGQEIGTTQERELIAPVPLPEGPHRWRVISIDRRGQETLGDVRTVRIDSRPPVVRVRVSGRRRAGQGLRVRVRASDPSGSGIASLRVDYGDGSSTAAASSVHRWRAGRWALEARAVDRAGNVGRARISLRIR